MMALCELRESLGESFDYLGVYTEFFGEVSVRWIIFIVHVVLATALKGWARSRAVRRGVG